MPLYAGAPESWMVSALNSAKKKKTYKKIWQLNTIDFEIGELFSLVIQKDTTLRGF